MAIKSRDDFAFLEVYRPVEEGMEHFMAHIRHEGDEIFGLEELAKHEAPKLVVADGVTEPVMAIDPIRAPRLLTYQNGQLRLPMVDSRAMPKMKLKFGNALRRTLNNPEEIYTEFAARGKSPSEAGRDAESATSEDKPSKPRDTHTSLAEIFNRIGRKYGVEDQHHVEVKFSAVDVPADAFLSHLGVEVVLVPDPADRATRMLKEQVEACARGLGRKSLDIAFPYTPAGLRVPFARMPSDVSDREYSSFIEMVRSRLPLRGVVLGGFKDNVGGASWQPTHKED